MTALLSDAEVARRYGVSVRTLRRWCPWRILAHLLRRQSHSREGGGEAMIGKKKPVSQETRRERKQWGALLRSSRRAKDISQVVIAGMCDVSQPTVVAWESGLAPIPATALLSMASCFPGDARWEKLHKSLSDILSNS